MYNAPTTDPWGLTLFWCVSAFCRAVTSTPQFQKCAQCALYPSLSLRFHGRCTTPHQFFFCRLQVDFGGTLITGSDVVAYFSLQGKIEAGDCVRLVGYRGPE